MISVDLTVGVWALSVGALTIVHLSVGVLSVVQLSVGVLSVVQLAVCGTADLSVQIWAVVNVAR